MLRMLSSLGLYSTRFEGPFLRDSVRFFETEGRLLIESASPEDFLSVGLDLVYHQHS